jgi:hypothetical protein
MRALLKFIILFGCFVSNLLPAKQWVKTYALEAYIGPEIYYVQRTKEGGAKQSGTLYGVRLGYDHIRRYKLYWGIDALWAQGALDGKMEDDHIKSTLTDINIEARLGYTFQSKSWRCASVTPYMGLGYFWENNCFRHPSPLPIHFQNRFTYIPLGFLSQIFVTPNWSIGVNVKVRFLFDSEMHASHDPEHDDSTQIYKEYLQYRIELPINYVFCWKSHSLAAGLVPFYEYRHYGYQANYPFDFLDTKLRLYGVTLKLFYLF